MATDGDTAGLRGIKVLIAEDEAVVAFDLEFTLGDFGCTVLPPVASAAEALALMARERPDVALLDVSLNDGPSTPVARELVAAGVPYAVTSGYDTEQIAESPAARRAAARQAVPGERAARHAAAPGRALLRRPGPGGTRRQPSPYSRDGSKPSEGSWPRFRTRSTTSRPGSASRPRSPTCC